MRERLDETIAAGLVEGLHAVVVIHSGQMVLEHYGSGDDYSWNRPLGAVDFGPHTLHDVRSVTKSITALVYGIALGDGLVPEPSAPLLAGFPEYPDLAADPERARLTVEHALTMSLGMEWKEEIPYNSPANAEIAMELAPDRYRFVLERPIVEPPGTRYSYSGGASALLGGLIARGTGRTLSEFAGERLFAPLGIESFEWMAGSDGVPSAASGLRLATPDLARVGEMVRAGGEWGGRQVVPAAWLRAMLEPRLPVEWGGMYCYQWYSGAGAGHPWVGAMGNGGQRLTVVPALGLVVAIAAGNYDDPEQWRTPDAVLERVVFPSVI
ncbi:serine hydrolase domain-containing protein [Phytohabitans sp. LJ34]|uniref:serine hydrolase domain-containing protein n=1 Tax=Phytohabitans sp. LJ34 TaxID=3452217 RepID=UPI003F8913B3